MVCNLVQIAVVQMQMQSSCYVASCRVDSYKAVLPGNVSGLGIGGWLCKTNLPVQVRQKGCALPSESSVGIACGLFAPVSRVCITCGLC